MIRRPIFLTVPVLLAVGSVGLWTPASAQDASSTPAAAPADKQESAEKKEPSAPPTAPAPSAGSRKNRPEPVRISVAAAREKAALLHDVYSETLDTVHHRYFHADRAVIPARAMEDIFDAMKRKHGYEGRWISASFTPMSIDHEPETAFEKEAARRIVKGEDSHETVEAGFYRRAGAISLSGGCVNCHSGSFGPPSPGRKFAGLIISIPVLPEDAAK